MRTKFEAYFAYARWYRPSVNVDDDRLVPISESSMNDKNATTNDNDEDFFRD